MLDMGPGRVPMFAVFRRTSALLSLRTMDFAVAGESDRAVSSLVSALRFLRAFEAEPILIAHLVRLANAGRASNDLAVVLGAMPSEPSLRTLEAHLRGAEAPDMVRRALLGERIWLIELARRPGDTSFWRDWQFRRKIAGEIGAMAPAVQAAGDPWPAVLSSLPAAAPRDEKAVLANTIEATGNRVALMRAGRVAALVEVYLQRHGELPSDLSEIAGSQLPVDPFTGNAFVYRRSDDGFSV